MCHDVARGQLDYTRGQGPVTAAEELSQTLTMDYNDTNFD